MNKFVVGCASIELAATNYDGFDSAHHFFCFSVIQDQDKDESDPPTCNADSKPRRQDKFFQISKNCISVSTIHKINLKGK